MQKKVQSFLLEFKKIASEKGIWLAPRPDSLETLRYLRFTKKNLKEIILNLSATDYYQGPQPDHTEKGEVWVFGKDLDGIEVYIKLKIVNEEMVKCLSFHIPVHPLSYPLRDMRKEKGLGRGKK